MAEHRRIQRLPSTDEKLARRYLLRGFTNASTVILLPRNTFGQRWGNKGATQVRPSQMPNSRFFISPLVP